MCVRHGTEEISERRNDAPVEESEGLVSDESNDHEGCALQVEPTAPLAAVPLFRLRISDIGIARSGLKLRTLQACPATHEAIDIA